MYLILSDSKRAKHSKSKLYTRENSAAPYSWIWSCNSWTAFRQLYFCFNSGLPGHFSSSMALVPLLTLMLELSSTKLLEVFWRDIKSFKNYQTSLTSLFSSCGLSRKYLVFLWCCWTSSKVNSNTYLISWGVCSPPLGPSSVLVTVNGSSPSLPPWIIASLSSFVIQI